MSGLAWARVGGGQALQSVCTHLAMRLSDSFLLELPASSRPKLRSLLCELDGE